MTTNEKSTMLKSYATILALLLMAFGSFVWFGVTVIDTMQQLTSNQNTISFNKGAYYLFGAGIGLGILLYAMVVEAILMKPLSAKQTKIMTWSAICSVVIIFVLPHLVHYSIAHSLNKRGYEVCEEASHQWLHSRTIVFVSETNVCRDIVSGKK